MPNKSTISTYMRYFHAVPSKFACANSNFFKIIFRFVCPYRSWSGRGWPIFSMLGVLFSRWVFIHLSLHERVAGNRDAQSHNESKINNNKIPWKVLVWRAPVDTASHGLWKNGGKEINFISCLGTAYNVSSMEDIGNSR